MTEYKKKPSICFVAQNAYGALAGRDMGHAGGIERQQSMMAQWFAKNGYDVSMLTWDEGYENGTKENGVRLYKMCTRSAGVPGIRFVYPRWTSLILALKQADADIYYYNCGDYGLGQIAFWARQKHKLVFSVASDPYCDPELPILKSFRERYLYRHGLHQSDKIIVQTSNQKNMLKQGFDLESEVIGMPFEGFSTETSSQKERSDNKKVLWVGRVSQEKRLEWLLDIADKLPDIEFDVVGAPNSSNAYADGLIARMNTSKNVTYHGRVAHNEMSAFYQTSGLLCCTSEFEGFPNTFLEAWSAEIPVVSTVDPDDLIHNRGFGAVKNNTNDLAVTIGAILADDEERRAMGHRANEYFHEHHGAEAIMPKFEKLFLELCAD